MDFAKVKVLLLAVFIGLNLFLIYQWRTLQTVVSVYTQPTSDQLADVQSALAARHVTIQTTIPNVQPQMSMLRVNEDKTGLLSIASAILSMKPKQADRFMVAPNSVLAPAGYVVSPRIGQIIVSYSEYPGTVILVDPAHPVEGVRQWLSRHGYNFGDYQLFGTDAYGGQTSVLYFQEYGAYPIFSAPLRVMIAANRLIHYEQTSLEVTGITSARPVMSAANALWSLVAYMDKAKINTDNTIEDVRLGYYSTVTSDAGWYLAPMWRVQSDLGTFYVNAFTGEVGVGSS